MGCPGADSSYFHDSDDIDAHYALAFLSVAEAGGGGGADVAKAKVHLDRLLGHPDADGDGNWGWGLRAPYDSRPAGTAYTYTTSLTGRAFLKAWSVTHDQKWLDAAERTADGIAKGIGYQAAGPGRVFVLSSSDHEDKREIVDTSAYAGALLLRVGKLTKRQDLAEPGMAAMLRVVDLQETNGNWHFITGLAPLSDPVHVAMNMRALVEAWQDTGDKRFRDAALAAADCLVADIWKDGLTSFIGPDRLRWRPGEVLIALGMIEDAFGRDCETSKVARESVTHQANGIFFGDPNRRTQSWLLYGLADYASRHRPGIRSHAPRAASPQSMGRAGRSAAPGG